MVAGSSGYDSNCESGHDSFIDSGFESRSCAACGDVVFTGACCASFNDRFSGACFDDITANECSQIGGGYKGDGTTCLDDDFQCGVPSGMIGNCCDSDGRRRGGTTVEGCITIFSGLGVSGSWKYPCHTNCLPPPHGHLCCFDQVTHWWCSPNSTCNPPNDKYEGVTDCQAWAHNPSVCPGCASGDPSPGTGACYDEGTTTCSSLRRRECMGGGLVWDDGEACSVTIYPGACCTGCERCIDDMPEYLCDKIGGAVWQGVSTTCAGSDCSGV